MVTTQEAGGGSFFARRRTDHPNLRMRRRGVFGHSARNKLGAARPLSLLRLWITWDAKKCSQAPLCFWIFLRLWIAGQAKRPEARAEAAIGQDELLHDGRLSDDDQGDLHRALEQREQPIQALTEQATIRKPEMMDIGHDHQLDPCRAHRVFQAILLLVGAFSTVPGRI